MTDVAGALRESIALIGGRVSWMTGDTRIKSGYDGKETLVFVIPGLESGYLPASTSQES